MVKMAIDQKILEEIKRYNSITKYINEQELPPPPVPDAGADAAGGPGAEVAPPPPVPPIGGDTATGDTAQNVDVTTDDEVEEVGPDGEPIANEGGEEGEDVEELDITELIDSQKNMSDKQEEYFNNLFSQLENLQSKLGEMDQLVQKLNSIEAKVEKFKPKTPEEKLELRSLDSGPFKQKLSDFFDDKKIEMEKSGKNEYVLTSDEIDNYSPSDIEKSFDNGIEPFDPEVYYK
jgi:hypothetical protein